jgi:Uma2 family endonuclease
MTRLGPSKKPLKPTAGQPDANGRGRAICTIVSDTQTVRIPPWVEDLASFRRWVHSGDFPETGRICFLNGEVWVDLSMEELFSHNQVKGEYTFVLTGLVKAGRLGRFIPDGMLITNVAANLSCEPDGSLVSTESLRTGRVRLVEGAEEGCIELEGTLDMALEVVSASSVQKDTTTLRDLYWRAGVAEYWLVDCRGQAPLFHIFRRTARGYVSVRGQGGWLKSRVFGKSFRLTRQTDELGNPEYVLEVR